MRLEIANESATLEWLGLHTPDGVKQFCGERVQDGSQEVFAIQPPGSESAFYLKRIGEIPFKFEEIILGLIRGRKSRIRREWENYYRLRVRGFETARPIAYGEDCSWRAERSTFIITEKAPGLALDEFLAKTANVATRRQVVEALAAMVRRMHDSGIFFPDLFARHIFVRVDRDGAYFCLIDVVRVYRSWIKTLDRRARDIAALMWSLSDGTLSGSEQANLLAVYSRGDFPRLADHVQRRVDKLVSRRGPAIACAV